MSNSQKILYGYSYVNAVDSVADLMLVKPEFNGQVYITSGASVIGDGNGTMYVWSDTSSATIDGVNVVGSQYSGQLGRWLIINTDVSALALRQDLSDASGSTLVGYQYNSSSIERTVDSRLKDIKTIKDFGAKGDGRTDDTIAFTKAISQGGKWFVPDGSYLITSNSPIINLNYFYGPGEFSYLSNTFPISKNTSNLVIQVPNQLPDIQTAIDYGSNLELTPTGGVTIQVADGTYDLSTITSTIIGGNTRLYIRGNETDPSKCVLNFDTTNNQSGFFASGETGFAWINGFTINGVGALKSTGVWNSQCYGAGIRAVDGASIVVGGNTIINNYYYGVSARYDGSIVCNGVTVNYAGDCGFHAYAASIDAEGCSANYCSDTAPGLGFGFCAESGGFINCDNSTATYNNMAGFYTNNGYMWAHGCVSHHNTNYGFYSLNGGNMDAEKYNTTPSNSYNNGLHGFACVNNSYMNINSAFATSNSNCGVFCSGNSVIDITVMNSSHNTFHGFNAELGGSLIGNGHTAYSNGQFGYFAASNSYISCNYATANSNTSSGVRAENNSTIDIPNCNSINNGGEGYIAVSNSTLSGDSSNAGGNKSDGYSVDTLSSLRGKGHSSTVNSGDGFIAKNISLIICSGLKSENNGGTAFSPYANTDAGNIGSYIINK